MGKFRISGLQWAIGAFSALVGALMLVAPHQFYALPRIALHSNLILGGGLFLLASLLLIESLAIPSPRRWVLFTHLYAGSLLIWLALNLLDVGGWIGGLNFVLLGIGIFLAGFLSLSRQPNAPPRDAELLSLLAGFGSILTGSLLLWQPPGLQIVGFRLDGSLIPQFGAAFLAAGLLLVLSQVLALRKAASAAVVTGFTWVVHWLMAALLFAVIGMGALPMGSWLVVTSFSGLGILMVLLPWLGPRLEQFSPARLRTRLALVLAIATSISLIVTVALVSSLEERSDRADTLARQENQAVTLAQRVAEYIRLHRAGLDALALQSGLISMSPEEQHTVLQIFARAYPDMISFSLFDAQGRLLSGSSELEGQVPLSQAAIFEQVQRTGKPSMEVTISPLTRRPVFEFGAPVQDENGKFIGMVWSGLSSTRVANFLIQQSTEETGQAYLVDGAGRIIADPTDSRLGFLSDSLGMPVLDALLSHPGGQGSLSYTSQSGELLAGYASVPGLSWGVIIETPASEALAGVRSGRDLAFAILVVFMLASAAAGFVMASRFTAPLSSLSLAVSELTAGNSAIPLPRSSFPELEQLAGAFEQLRARLAARTREREQAEQALRRAKEGLEARVDQRTAELNRLNSVLQHQKELLETIFETDPGGMAVVTGEDLVFQYSNPAYRALTPHPEVDPLGRRFDEIWPKGEEFRGSWLLQRALVSGKPVRLDSYVQQFPDGSTRYFSLHVRRLAWEEQPAALVVLWETTNLELAHQKAEQAAQEALRRAAEAEEGRSVLEALMEYIPMGIAIADAPDARIRMVSRYGQELAGMTPAAGRDRLTGEQVLQQCLFHPEDFSPAAIEETPLNRAVRLGETIGNEEWILQGTSGAMVPILCNAGPIRNQNGEITGGIWAWVDITDRKRAELTLKTYTEQLEHVNRELQDFTSIASHDLQEPLRKIQAFSERLKADYNQLIGEQGRDYLDRLQNAAWRMQTMIEDLLNYSRVTTQAQPFRPVDLNQVAREVLSDLEIRVERSGGQVELEELPTLDADALQMRQLLQNLLSNALKYHHPETPPFVRVSARRLSSGKVQIMVEDNGIGFEEKNLERIFQPFQRLHGRSEYEGTGIGLAICRKIVARHHGSITARSQVGQGATFIITLPIKQRPDNGERLSALSG